MRIKIETVCTGTLQQSGQTNRNSSSPSFPSIGPTSLRGSNHHKLHAVSAFHLPHKFCNIMIQLGLAFFFWSASYLLNAFGFCEKCLRNKLGLVGSTTFMWSCLEFNFWSRLIHLFYGEEFNRFSNPFLCLRILISSLITAKIEW